MSLTRPELQSLMADSGFSISERKLRYWTYRGLLPKPVRRARAHALYPDWTANLLRLLLDAFHKGHTTEDLKNLAPALATRCRETPVETWSDAPPPRMTRAVRRAAWDYARAFDVDSIELTITTKDGTVMAVPVPRISCRRA